MDFGKNSVSLDCPHCGVNRCHFELSYRSPQGYNCDVIVKSIAGEEVGVKAERNHLIYTCSNCSGQVYVLLESWGNAWIDPHSAFREGTAPPPPPSVRHGSQAIHQYPVSTPVVHTSVPSTVKSAANEAEQCLAVRAFNACGVMTRRAVDALCFEKNANGSNLYERLKDLADRHELTPDLWAWAEELRIVGRSGAHPEWEEVSEDDARYAVEFCREIIRYVYINPYERDQRRLKESKKKK